MYYLNFSLDNIIEYIVFALLGWIGKILADAINKFFSRDFDIEILEKETKQNNVYDIILKINSNKNFEYFKTELKVTPEFNQWIRMEQDINAIGNPPSEFRVCKYCRTTDLKPNSFEVKIIVYYKIKKKKEKMKIFEKSFQS